MPNGAANRLAAPALQARSKTLPKRLQPGAQPVKIGKLLQVLRGAISKALCKPLAKPALKTEATNLFNKLG